MFLSKEIKFDNPLLNHLSIYNENTKFSCKIYPNLGASLQELTFNNIAVIDGITPNEEGLKTYKNKYNSSILFPFPGRVSNGKFTYNKQKYQLTINEPGRNNALHGCVYNQAFQQKNTVLNKNMAQVTYSYTSNGLTPGYPFKYTLDVIYTFKSDNSIQLEFNVQNIDKTSFPFGLGWHPYFIANNLSSSILNFQATKQTTVNERMIPIGTQNSKLPTHFEVANNTLDDCFYLNKNNIEFNTGSYKLNLSIPDKENTNFLQLYTPLERESIAIEPMTCEPNSFNSGIGQLELHPNDTFQWNVILSLNF